nr:MAG TPA: hypothetical protein [Caudoviricetes sp.]
MHPVLILVFLCAFQSVQIRTPPGHFSGAAPSSNPAPAQKGKIFLASPVNGACNMIQSN